MWCDINTSVVNKDVKNWFEFNNSFVTKRLSVDELIKEIQAGHSYTTVHQKQGVLTKTARHSSNFKFATHFGLDFDDTFDDFLPTLDAISKIPIVAKYASFIHTTASHTESSPRARAVFLFDNSVSDPDVYTMGVAYANRVVGVTDTSCTDPVRLFFGAKDCQVKMIGNTLSSELFAEWAAKEEVAHKPPTIERYEQKIIDASQFTKYVEVAISAEVNELSNAAQGDRHMHLLKSSSRLGSIMKSPWAPSGILTADSISAMLMAACHDNGLVKEDGQRAVYTTIQDGINNATPRDMPPTEEIRKVTSAHSELPISTDILTISEIDRAYGAWRSKRVNDHRWNDVSDKTLNDLGIIFTEQSVIIPFIDDGSMNDIAYGGEREYKYQVGVDTTMNPDQPNSDGTIAVVTKNPADVVALFDKIRNSQTRYEVFGTSEIGKGVANRLAKDYKEVIFLTYDADNNIDIAKSAVPNSGKVSLQGTLREMFSWGLDEITFNTMLGQAW